MLSLISALVSGSLHRTVARTKRNGIFVAIAGLLFLTAYGFALVAAAIWLAGIYGAIGATLLVAAGALLLGIIALVTMMVVNRQERRAREQRAGLDSVAAAALDIVKTQPLLTTAIAAAFVLSNIVGSRKDTPKD